MLMPHLPREFQYVIKRRIFEGCKENSSLPQDFSKGGGIIVDTTYPDHSIYPIEDLPNWKDFYPDAEEEIPDDFPILMGPKKSG